MEQRLRSIFRSTDWKGDPNKAAERAAYYARLLQQSKLAPADEYRVRLEMAQELLRNGDSEASLQALDEAARRAETAGLRQPAEARRAFLHLHGIASLRLGEQENCLEMHGQHSCLFPIREGGVHHLPRGAQGAVRDFTSLLASDPSDALAQWLLNVAYMQLGRWPRDVPARWRMSDKLFASEADLGEFPDMASLAGVDVFTRSGGALMEDFDGDGLKDIVTSTSDPLGNMHLFHNNGDGTFTDRTREAGLTGEIGGLNMVLTDFDNDGHPDILVLRGAWWGHFGEYPMSLLHNRGDGTFEDVTVKAGLLVFGPTQTAAWADYDNDGYLDLFVGHESQPAQDGKPAEHFPSQLFHNNGDGTFTEVGHGIEVNGSSLDEQGFVKGVAWGDFNNDGRPDLYISVKAGQNHLLRNDGPVNPAHPDAAHWRFTDVTESSGIGHLQNTFSTWFFDYDNDGWPDLFVAGYSMGSTQDVGRFQLGRPADAAMPHLFHNNHNGTFTDVSHALHLDRAALTMGASFGDLDNDGWLDVYLGTGEPSYEALLPNRMFRNDAGRRFQDVTTSGGFGHLQKGHAVAFGDLENRGVEDVFEEMGGAFPGDGYQSALYRNPDRRHNHSITLRLEGTTSNRAGYGARIDAVFTDVVQGRPVRRHVFRSVGSVSSFGGNPMEQHIGIGAATRVDEVHIRWPAHPSAEQVLHALPADRTYAVREGAEKATVVPRKTFSLGQKIVPQHSMASGMVHAGHEEEKGKP